MDTTDDAVIGSWGRSTNDDYVSSVLEMTSAKNMDIGQMLRQGVRSDLHGHPPRLCLTNMIYRLIMLVTMTNGMAPLFIDLVSCYQKKKGMTEQMTKALEVSTWSQAWNCVVES